MRSRYSFLPLTRNSPCATGKRAVCAAILQVCGSKTVSYTHLDAGTSGTQQFVLEDVPRAVDQYGTETAFFGTNTSQQEPMIKCVVNTKSYFTMPSDPSPFVGFPSALGIEVPADKLYEDVYKRQTKRNPITTRRETPRKLTALFIWFILISPPHLHLPT